MDGNSLIGEDKSGNGNNWTPINFGGSNSIEKATGALPILNTVNGGTTATATVREDANASNLIFALPLAGDITEVTPRINNARTALSFTDSGSTDTVVSHFQADQFSKKLHLKKCASPTSACCLTREAARKLGHRRKSLDGGCKEHQTLTRKGSMKLSTG